MRAFFPGIGEAEVGDEEVFAQAPDNVAVEGLAQDQKPGPLRTGLEVLGERDHRANGHRCEPPFGGKHAAAGIIGETVAYEPPRQGR